MTRQNERYRTPIPLLQAQQTARARSPAHPRSSVSSAASLLRFPLAEITPPVPYGQKLLAPRARKVPRLCSRAGPSRARERPARAATQSSSIRRDPRVLGRAMPRAPGVRASPGTQHCPAFSGGGLRARRASRYVLDHSAAAGRRPAGFVVIYAGAPRRTRPATPRHARLHRAAFRRGRTAGEGGCGDFGSAGEVCGVECSFEWSALEFDEVNMNRW